jgi:hypothetical protein
MTKQLGIDCLLFSLYNMNLTTRGLHIICFAFIILDPHSHPLSTSSVSMPITISIHSFGNTQSMSMVCTCQDFTIDNWVLTVDDDIVTTLQSTSSDNIALSYLGCYLVILRVW